MTDKIKHEKDTNDRSSNTTKYMAKQAYIIMLIGRQSKPQSGVYYLIEQEVIC